MKKILGLLSAISFIISSSISNVSFVLAEENTYTYNGHTYKFIETLMTWDEARQACEDLGGHLATFTTQEEWKYIYQYIYNSEKQYWLGGSDDGNEGEWVWITGEKWSYSDWCNNEPNNDYSGTEDYLGTYTSTYQWNDYRKSEKLGFICEWDNEIPNGIGNKKNEFNKKANALKRDYEKAISTWMSQADLNVGSWEYRKKWDLLLNEVYSYLKSILGSEEFEKLKTDEIKWIAEKEAAVAIEEKYWEGGSGQHCAMNNTDIEYTSKRVYYLISLIDNTISGKSISVILNGETLTFEQQLYIENGTTRVPMRKIFESLGATVEYDAKTKTITARKDGTVIELVTGSTTAKINGRSMTLVADVSNKNGSTMVPLRFVSEALGAEVIWDGENRTIIINLDESVTNTDNNESNQNIFDFEKDYIDKHSKFINSSDYEYVKNLDLPQNIAESLSDDKKMQTAVKLNDALSFNWLEKNFNNYYDIILSDMFLSESVYNNIENQFKTKYINNTNSFTSNISKILEEKYTKDFTVDDKTFLEKLFLSDEEIKDTKTYEKLEKMLNDTFEENEIIEMLNYGNKLSTTVDFMSKGVRALEAIKNTARYYSVVNSYIDTKQEYKDALKIISTNLSMKEVLDNSNEQYGYFKESLDRYIELNDKNDKQVSLEIAGKAVSEGIEASIDMFGDEYVNCAVTFVKSIKLSNGLTIAEAASKATAGNAYLATAADVMTGLGAAKIGYDIGMLFNNSFLPNNDISINVKYLETNGNMATVTKRVLESCEYNFIKNPTYENAQKFDGVFSFYKGIQIDTCKRMIALDESEKRNLINIFSAQNQQSLDESINNSKQEKEKLEKVSCY